MRLRGQPPLCAILSALISYNRGNSPFGEPAAAANAVALNGELNSPCAHYYFRIVVINAIIATVISRARAKRCSAEAPHFVWKRQMNAATLLCGGLPSGNRKPSDSLSYCHFDRAIVSGEISKRQFGQARDFSVRSLRSLSRNDNIHSFSTN